MHAPSSRVLRTFLRGFAALCLGAYGAGVNAAGPAAAPAKEDSAPHFILARALPAPLPKRTSGQLESRFGASFPHAPFNTGFDAFVLPFHYVDPANLGHASEAQAFAFLLSNDLDWAPGSFCNHHCYFAFKSSREVMEPMAKSYDGKIIGELVSGWGATLAVGGTLTPKKGGLYTGHMMLYNAQGNVAWQKSYADPQSFWDLLGHASADVMTALGDKPGDALAAYLRKPRCQKMDSLAALGNAAFMEARSKDEFDTYDDILKADPGFAEVRAWYANQKQWATRDILEMTREDAKALDSRILPGVLATLNSGPIDPKVAAKLPQWLDQARALSSADAPYILAPALQMVAAKQPITASDRELLALGVKSAARHPNSGLLYVLSQSFSQDAPGEDDMDMGASVAWAYYRSRFQPGLDKAYVGGVLMARPLMSLGYYDLAAEFLASAATDPRQADAYLYCLTEIGQFQAACRYYDSFAANSEAQSGMATGMIIPAAMAGRRDILVRLLKDNSATMAQNGGHAIIQAFIDRLDGKEPAKAPGPAGPLSAPYPFGVARSILLFDDDIRSHGQAFRIEASDECRSAPINRIAWIMKDTYSRIAPFGDSNDFYLALEYLHPDDPWVEAAVADWRIRTAATGRGAGAPTDPAYALKNMTDFDLGLPVDIEKASAWVITTGVMQFAEQKKFADARHLATLYRTASLHNHRPDCVALAQHLLHQIDAAEHPTTAPAAPAK